MFIVMMKKIKYLLIFIVLVMCVPAIQAKDKKLMAFNYELTREGCPVSRDANYVIFTVYSYGKRAEVTADVSKRNAVHGILFKGLPATQMQGAIPAMMGTTSYAEHQDYFDNFFSTEQYLQFVEETNRGFEDVIKLKKGYKIGVTVKVNIQLLQRRLEADGILQNVMDMMLR